MRWLPATPYTGRAQKRRERVATVEEKTRLKTRQRRYDPRVRQGCQSLAPMNRRFLCIARVSRTRSYWF